jgi:hypothetical protein
MKTTRTAALLLGFAWLSPLWAADPPPAPVIAPMTSGDKAAPKDDAARLEVSGKVQLDLIYDFKSVDPAWNTTLRPSKIPINCPGPLGTADAGCGKDGETIFSVRQTAISFKGFVPTQAGQLKTDLSLDLFNVGGANTGFRLLHAWAEIGAFGVGQYETLFMNLDLFPNTIDYWGPAGMIFVRNPQIRYTPYKTDTSRVAVSLEAPYAGVDTGKVSVADPNLGGSIVGWTKYPDIVGKYSMNGDWGFFDLGGVVRWVGYKTTSTPDGNPSGSKTGWGVTADGALNLFGKDRLVTQVTYGEGIASYFNDGGVDLAPDGSLHAQTVKSIGMMLYYDHSWSSKWASSIGYSQHHQTNADGQLFNAFRTGSYASTNLLYTPAKNVMWGAEFVWGKKEQKDGESATDSRVQFTGQFKF